MSSVLRLCRECGTITSRLPGTAEHLATQVFTADEPIREWIEWINFELVKDHADWQSTDGVHFNATGSETLAQQVRTL